MLQILALSGIITIGIGVIKTSKSWFWKVIWGIIVFCMLMFMVIPE